MRERQGCRSASIQGDTGDLGDQRFCRLRVRRVDGAASTVPGDGRRLLARPAPRCALPPSFGFQHTSEGE